MGFELHPSSSVPNLFGGKAGKQLAVLVAFDQIVDPAFLVAGTDHFLFLRLWLNQRHHKVRIRAVGDDESKEGVGADTAFAGADVGGSQLGEGFHRGVSAAGNIRLHIDGFVFPDGLNESDQIDSRGEGWPLDEVEYGPSAGRVEVRHDFAAEKGIFIVQFAVGHESGAYVPRLVAGQFFFRRVHIIIPCLDYFFHCITAFGIASVFPLLLHFPDEGSDLYPLA